MMETILHILSKDAEKPAENLHPREFQTESANYSRF